jgi:hypothetical protein
MTHSDDWKSGSPETNSSSYGPPKNWESQAETPRLIRTHSLWVNELTLEAGYQMPAMGGGTPDALAAMLARKPKSK